METFKVYGFIGLVRLILDKFITIIYCNNMRIIRRPFYIRGRRNISFGKGLTTGTGIRLDAFPKEKEKKCLLFGNDIEINDYVHIAAVEKVSIGNNVLIASKVFISDHNHGNYSGSHDHDNPNSLPKERKLFSNPVIVEDNVWIGENVCILPGVTIGKGAIIGAMSLVNRDIPANTLAVGNPAKVIKRYNSSSRNWEKV